MVIHKWAILVWSPKRAHIDSYDIGHSKNIENITNFTVERFSNTTSRYYHKFIKIVMRRS